MSGVGGSSGSRQQAVAERFARDIETVSEDHGQIQFQAPARHSDTFSYPARAAVQGKSQLVPSMIRQTIWDTTTDVAALADDIAFMPLKAQGADIDFHHREQY